MYKSIGQARRINGDVQDVLTEGWQPGVPSYASNGTWSRLEDAREGATGPEVCWESDGAVQPLGLYPMTNEEREVCDIRPSRGITFAEFYLALCNLGQFPDQAAAAERGQGGRANARIEWAQAVFLAGEHELDLGIPPRCSPA